NATLRHTAPKVRFPRVWRHRHASDDPRVGVERVRRAFVRRAETGPDTPVLRDDSSVDRRTHMADHVGALCLLHQEIVAYTPMNYSRLVARLVPLLMLAVCTGSERGRPLFKLLSPDQTGVTFANTITTSDSLNVQTDVYVYNGAGVAVGDIDNDGLPDIFFAGNMVSSRLYLNKGQMRFDDITTRAGVGTKRW